MSPFRRILVLSAALLLSLLLAPTSGAATTELLGTTLTAPGAERQSCVDRPLDAGRAVVTRTFTAPATGWLTARLDADGGDWDVAVFERGTSERAAGAASFGATEVAQGIVLRDREYVVQVCRRSGEGSSARLDVGLQTFTSQGTGATLQLVRVSTPTLRRANELADLGLDLVEHSGDGYRLAVLYGPQDADALVKGGFQYVVVVDDLLAESAADRRAERRAAAAGAVKGFPSGQTTYRRLADYEQDLKELAEANPDLVRPVTLPNKTYEGRTVQGIELASDVKASDGRPTFLMMGVHHAREWPSGEHAIEWAYELLRGLKAGEPRATRLMRESRALVVPLVNPDGFNASREAGQRRGHGNGDPQEDVLTAVLTSPEEYRRKNCRRVFGEGGECVAPGVGLAENGVDPNRNYGGFWGGPGASSASTNLTYRGPAPFSEPETKNIRQLFLQRPIALHISNHTFSNLWLRPPGVASQGLTPDEPLYKRIGDSAAAENGYRSILSYQLYDTTGTTEDWTYWTAGSLGFTPEIGCQEYGEQPGDCAVGGFHPPFGRSVAEWSGDTDFARNAKAGGGGGNREAYYLSQEAALDRSSHSVLTGTAPAGATLRLRKTHQTPTSQKGVTFEDAFDHTTVVAGDGRFEWRVNPSTRPLAAQERGRPATGEPSPPVQASGTPNPATNRPCADFDTNNPSCFDDHPFEVPANGGGVDNASMTVRMQWTSQVSDWDLKVFRDNNGNGVSDTGDEVVGSSGQFPTNFEETTIAGDKFGPGKYVARAINYAAFDPYTIKVTFKGPEEFKPSQTESWTLTCEVGGEVRAAQDVVVARGETRQLDLAACGRTAQAESAAAPRPAGAATGTALSRQEGAKPTQPRGCTPTNGFRSTKVSGKGRRVAFGFRRALQRPVDVDVFQQSIGRRVIGERLVARYTSRSGGFTWNGKANRRGRKVTDGYYFVRYRMPLGDGRVDVRRATLRRVKGRFSLRPVFYRRDTCGLLRSYKLTRPVFGGRSNREVNIAYRLNKAARVGVVVTRGTRVVRRYRALDRDAATTYRLRLASEKLGRGDYKVRITVRAGKTTETSTLTTRRL